MVSLEEGSICKDDWYRIFYGTFSHINIYKLTSVNSYDVREYYKNLWVAALISLCMLGWFDNCCALYRPWKKARQFINTKDDKHTHTHTHNCINIISQQHLKAFLYYRRINRKVSTSDPVYQMSNI